MKCLKYFNKNTVKIDIFEFCVEIIVVEIVEMISPKVQQMFVCYKIDKILLDLKVNFW